MTTAPSNLTTGKIFGEVAKSHGFQGTGGTRYIEYPTYYLVLNHQKSSYGKSFYINVALIYKELSDKNFDVENFLKINKKYSSLDYHVHFRIERCPTVNRDLQNLFDTYVKEDRVADLQEPLSEAVGKMIDFLKENHDRKTIRELSDNKKLSALVAKEV